MWKLHKGIRTGYSQHKLAQKVGRPVRCRWMPTSLLGNPTLNVQQYSTQTPRQICQPCYTHSLERSAATQAQHFQLQKALDGTSHSKLIATAPPWPSTLYKCLSLSAGHPECTQDTWPLTVGCAAAQDSLPDCWWLLASLPAHPTTHPNGRQLLAAAQPCFLRLHQHRQWR